MTQMPRPYKVRTRRAILVERGLSYCYECKLEKPFDEFYFNKKGPNAGRPGAKCKPCTIKTGRVWHQASPERGRESARRCHQKVRREVLEHYSNSTMQCACCGESEEAFLTLDHLNNDGAEHRRRLDAQGGGRHGSTRVYTDLRQRGFPSGFQVLCINCNAAKGWRGACPHTLAEYTVDAEHF